MLIAIINTPFSALTYDELFFHLCGIFLIFIFNNCVFVRFHINTEKILDFSVLKTKILAYWQVFLLCVQHLTLSSQQFSKCGLQSPLGEKW